jgi:hypothetical protein
VVAADLNGDGKLDLATANANSQNVSVLQGNGDGTFAAATTYATGQGPYSDTSGIAAGDLNGDGKLELVIANPDSKNVSVLRNNGDGTFASRVIYTLPYGAGDVVLSDFSRDGKLDVAVSSYLPNGVYALRNNGDGTLGAPSFFTAGSNPVTVVAGDFNSDNRPDIVAANSNSHNLSLLLNQIDTAVKFQVESSTSPVAPVCLFRCM